MTFGNRSGTEAELLDWLRTHVRRDDECLVWAGSYQHERLPVVSWAGKKWMARRLLVTLARGPVPKGWRVWATCGTEGCIAEDHLRVGSAGTHNRWVSAQGLYKTGLVHSLACSAGRAPRAKMGLAKRQEAIDARAAGQSWAEIGARYGIAAKSAQRIVQRWDSVMPR